MLDADRIKSAPAKAAVGNKRGPAGVLAADQWSLFMKSFAVRYLVAAGVAFAILSAASTAARAGDIARERTAAADFTLTDSSGASVKLSSYKGKVVVLDFWATWCTGCKVEIPWYMEFQKKYQPKGLATIGVAMDEDGWKRVRPYLAQHPINYPIVIGDERFAALYRVTALPVTLLIDRNGKIADAHTGMVDKDAWEREIRQLLQEKGTPQRHSVTEKTSR
jgi:thiol-disulfide isomerase/thioredoxin